MLSRKLVDKQRVFAMPKASRPCIVVGNWKMYKTIDQALSFVEEITPLAETANCKVLLAVPFTAIRPVADKVKGTKIVIGAQNMNDASEGAFTGEIAGVMLKDAGAEFVLLGHSERRKFFHESNDFINKKLQQAIKNSLAPLLCIGETYEERQEEQSKAVVKTQLEECLKDVPKEVYKTLMIAYEPRWAIGTGLAATSEMIQEMSEYCRQVLTDLYGEKEALKVSILYGGSVSPQNAQELFQTPGVDGLLVGSASLQPESFSKILRLRQSI